MPSGVSVGIHGLDPGAARRRSPGTWRPGYVRVKLKIEPGWDLEPVRAVRERFGDDLLLQVDANTAYTLADARHLARLDAFDLLLIEQPLDEEDLLGHAELAKARQDADLPGRVDHLGPDGGRRDQRSARARSSTSSRAGSAATWRRAGSTTCAAAHGVAGLVRRDARDRASAGRRTSPWRALPGFTLPGDTSASDRYYSTDITEPFVLDGRPPRRPDRTRPRRHPDRRELTAVTTWTEWIGA